MASPSGRYLTYVIPFCEGEASFDVHIRMLVKLCYSFLYKKSKYGVHIRTLPKLVQSEL